MVCNASEVDAAFMHIISVFVLLCVLSLLIIWEVYILFCSFISPV
jgi:hypothetical protein